MSVTLLLECVNIYFVYMHHFAKEFAVDWQV